MLLLCCVRLFTTLSESCHRMLFHSLLFHSLPFSSLPFSSLLFSSILFSSHSFSSLLFYSISNSIPLYLITLHKTPPCFSSSQNTVVLCRESRRLSLRTLEVAARESTTAWTLCTGIHIGTLCYEYRIQKTKYKRCYM